jgi:hypothetical protein
LNYAEIPLSHFDVYLSLAGVLELIKSERAFLSFKNEVLGVIDSRWQKQVFRDLRLFVSKAVNGERLTPNDLECLDYYLEEKQVQANPFSAALLSGRRELRRSFPYVINIPVFPDSEGLRLDILSYDAELNFRLFYHVEALATGQESVGICAAVGCDNFFAPQTTLQQYCSVRCRARQAQRDYRLRRKQ